MLTVNDKGNVGFELDGKKYDLGDSDDYTKFLLWITKPEADGSIVEGAFAVDGAITDEEARLRLERYSEFFKGFLVKRGEILAVAAEQGRTTETRQKEIKDLIAELNGDQGDESLAEMVK